MGSWYFSACVHQAKPSEVKDAISAWLRRKGYELEVRQPLFSLVDSEEDRGVVLATSGSWTIVHYSHLGEWESLGEELCRLGHPVLSCWLAHSDAWGYELHCRDEVVSAFNSNPHYFGPPEAPAGPNDIPLLCRTIGAIGTEHEIARLQSRWRPCLFKEDKFRQFATLLDIRPAASLYRYIEDGEDEDIFKSSTTEHLWFRRISRDPMEGFDLHAQDVRASAPDRWVHSHVPGYVQDMTADMQREMAAHIRMWMLLLWPLRLLARLIFLPWQLKIWWHLYIRGVPNDIASVPPWPREGDEIINVRHQCRLEIKGAALSKYFRTGVSDVFAFDLEGILVTCTAMDPRVVRRNLLHLPEGAKWVEEDWHVDGRPARTVQYSWRSDQGQGYALDYYVQGPRAIYQFHVSLQQQPTEAFGAKLRAIVATMKFTDASAGSP